MKTFTMSIYNTKKCAKSQKNNIEKTIHSFSVQKNNNVCSMCIRSKKTTVLAEIVKYIDKTWYPYIQ